MYSILKFPYTKGEQIFEQVADKSWSLFFDSGNDGERPPRAQTERFDVILAFPVATLVTTGLTTQIQDSESVQESDQDPLSLLQEQLARRFPSFEQTSHSREMPPYLPGGYGYFSYDLSRRFEDLPNTAADPEKLPEMAVGLYDSLVLLDHQNRTTSLVYLNESSDSAKRWRSCLDNLSFSDTNAAGMPLQCSDLRPNQTPEEYREKFDAVRKYTVEGDCYQVNLTQRFSSDAIGSAWVTYQHLRSVSPAPYGCFMHLPFAEILSNSPESFIRCRDRQVTTSPIKGTRARDHQDKRRDQEIAQELFNSDKDRAENLMIVDLMRNDLSRSCELGSVKVPSLFSLHAFANVHHLISTVTGVLRVDLHALDLLRSCFPGGSITGAPKIRAMEIIEELEPERRGLYCGAIGYVGMDGSLETNIAIRTIVVKDGVARFSAGGGLVIDSDLDLEYQELMDKASMMRRVLS